MKKLSAGLLAYRIRDGRIEVLIAHMGAPWWSRKDRGAWSIPKGEYEDGDDALANAKREFKEELGLEPPEGELMELGQIEQKNNKIVTAWAVEADLDVSNIKSNTFVAEWPPRSGQKQEFPEIDRAAYVSINQAKDKLVFGQAELLERLAAKLGKQVVQTPKAEQSSLF